MSYCKIFIGNFDYKKFSDLKKFNFVKEIHLYEERNYLKHKINKVCVLKFRINKIHLEKKFFDKKEELLFKKVKMFCNEINMIYNSK